MKALLFTTVLSITACLSLVAFAQAPKEAPPAPGEEGSATPQLTDELAPSASPDEEKAANASDKEATQAAPDAAKTTATKPSDEAAPAKEAGELSVVIYGKPWRSSHKKCKELLEEAEIPFDELPSNHEIAELEGIDISDAEDRIKVLEYFDRPILVYVHDGKRSRYGVSGSAIFYQRDGSKVDGICFGGKHSSFMKQKIKKKFIPALQESWEKLQAEGSAE